VDGSIAIEKDYSVLLTVFAVIALLVAGAGVYATLTYWVSQRRFELGIRMALGASRPALVGTVLRTGMMAVAGDLLVGLPVAVLASEVVQKISPLVQSLSADVLVVALLVLTSVAASACLLPALSASRMHPAVVLKR
jgi:ABC-type antimicrobial peptide transport system permease subunit